MASKFLSERTKTILYWTAIVVLFALFLGFLVAYITKQEGTTDAPTSEPPPVTTPLPPTEEEIRLDDNVVPNHYSLDITSDHENDQFSGIVTIDFEAKESSSQVKLHCKNLNIQEYILTSDSGSTVKIQNFQTDSTLELCIFNVATRLTAGNYSIKLTYVGVFKSGQISGFYKSSYLTVDNQKRYLTATKFEPTYARLAFPSFDEPRFKATFDISIVHPKSLNALSNEDEFRKEDIASKEGWTRTTFKRTVPMPTYLVAFIVSDFKYSETRTTYGTRVRVYSRPDQVEKTRYAVETAAKIVRFLEDYTAIPYSLSKLDLIGLPEFVSGAMENWGLVTYKETYVLFSESGSSIADMKQITSVIAHELSHSYFGNYATLAWWNDLWLNEGFASYIEYKGIDYVNKSWNVMDTFLTSDLQPALRADSQSSARSVVSTVLTPDQITSIFDTFSYSKGASVLYMLENIIGTEAFQRCSRNYLNAHQFGTVKTADMFESFKDDIQKATNIEGETFLRKYLYSNSYAIVNVQRVGEDSLKLTQNSYNAMPGETLQEAWNMQVSYLLPNRPSGAFIMSQVSQTFKLNDKLAATEWFKLNAGSTGYYIVNYSSNDWTLLINQLKEKATSLPLKDRTSLLFDAGQLSDKALLDYNTLFNLLDYLKGENEYMPWSVASSTISSIQSKLTSTSSFSLLQFNAYIRNLVNLVFDDNVDFAANPSTMTFQQISLRNTLISVACRVDYEKCTEQASALFRRWLDSGLSVDANIRSLVYKYGLKASTNDQDWQRVWDLYQSEKDALEKSKLMSALTSTTSSTMLLTLIKYSHDPNIINNENFFTVQQNIASNSLIGRGMIWEYIKENWSELKERFGLNDRRLGNYVKSVTSGFGTALRLQEMEDFFNREPEAGAGTSARLSALEAVKKNIQWATVNEPKISTALSSRDQFSRPWLNWRLDESVRPSEYQIQLTINVDEEKFNGNVSITLTIQKPIRYLILHSKDLQIKSSNVFTKKEKTLVSLGNGSFAYEPNQFWVIPMAQIISPGEYVAELTFSGVLSSSLNGLYISRYTRSTTNETVKLATTQMEAGFARKAFPCLDEPLYKSKFTLAITHDNKYNAISNMPVDYIQKTQDETTTRFKQSVRMSTYLVAFVVSDFVSKKSSLSSDFAVYTYNPEINLPKTEYALTVGPKLLDYYAKNYFKIPYPLPKTDMISIPDFSMGAMENWGLVTYRDVYILFDESESTSASKMQVCSIIAHELAHMWYGNLVTIKWWNDLWLNEGFAQFMMYKATAVVEPSWKYNEHFVIKELSRVFDIDSSLSTHSILTPVNDENDMQAIFDSVTYAKSSSILRMLENTLGEENFRQAVNNYLTKYSFENTETADLWHEFANLSLTLDVPTMMDSWIRKEGFPVVTVTETGGRFTFKQERFYKDYDHSNFTYTWSIPLTYHVFDPKNADLENPIGRILFHNQTIQTTIAEYTGNSLIKFNVNQMGLYILNYPTSQWNKFIDLLNDNTSLAWQKMSSLDRNNLLSDAFYLSRSGRLKYDITLRLASFLRFERSYIVWVTASDMLRYLRTFAITEDQGIAFNQWMLTIVSPSYDELGWDVDPDDDLNRRQFRALILDLACLSGHEHCISTANNKFDEFIQQGSTRSKRAALKPNPDIFNIFLYHAMRTVKEETDPKYTHLMDLYQSALSTNEKMRYLRALAVIQSPTLLTQLVDKSLDTAFLRSQDYFTFLAYIASNPVGLDIAWKSYRNNFQTIQDRFGLDDSNLGRAIYRFAANFNSATRRQEVLDLYAKYPKAGASELYRQQSIELIDANLKWSKKFYSTVIEHFTNQCDSTICPWNVYRLNDNISPSVYRLIIQVNTNSFLYNGTVKATISVKEPVNYIIMHAASILTPSKPSVRLAPTLRNSSQRDDTEYSVGSGFRYAPLEFYVIPLKQALPVDFDYVVEVSFEGNLTFGGQVGLYRGYYTMDNETVNLASTQFESTHARKVFPTFDEPHFKSFVDMSIIHEESKTTTLTNMPAKETVPYQPGWVITSYERSVKMVTYLVAILVSDFQCTSNKYADIGPGGTMTISTCASKLHAMEKHDYANNVTHNILRHYESYLKSPYQLTKLDQIGLPQFSAGAMENWGLVKYREKMLLWTDDEENSAEQRSVVAVIAHELAHMWFGNLLTCDFWGELWLNEAFASYMEFAAVAHVHPEWNYFDTIAYYDQFNAMLSDSIESSQPIVRNVLTPDLMSYASAIVYNKGSSILHMFNATMGQDKFQYSLQKYLSAYKDQSVVTDNLFDKFSDNWNYPEQDIKVFLQSWTYQAGFPYLNISLNADKASYTVTQERFLQNGSRPKTDTLYTVPFAFYSLDGKSKKLRSSAVQFLSQKTTVISGEFKNSIKVNPAFTGFYLVNYPEDYWTELSTRLVDNSNDFVNSLMVNDRAELFISSFFLARAKLAPYLVPFRLYNYLVNEKHFVPWYFYDYTLSYMAMRMDRTEYRESLMQFERRLTLPHYTGIQFWDDSKGHNLERSFRQLLITITCRSGNQQCLTDAWSKFTAWKASNADISFLPPNLRANILCYGLRASKDNSDYEFVWQQYKKTKDTSPLKTIFLQSLSFISDQKSLKQYIDASLDESAVTSANFVTFFNYIIQNYAHESMAWQYFVENYSMLARKLTSAQVDSIVSRFAMYAVTSARKQEISSYLGSTLNVGTASGRTSALQRVDSNLAWMASRKVEVGQFLTQNACGGTKPEPCPWGLLRIDKNTSYPTTYDVLIQVNVTTYKFNGTVDVHVKTLTDLDYLALNAASMLSVNLTSVTGANGVSISAQMFRYRPQDYVIVRFAQTQPAADYIVRFAYSGSLLDAGLSGLYLSNYTENGQSVGLASTQFEFYDARKVFPSFDEPAFKSTFTLSVIHDKKMSTTLSNMDVESQDTPVDGMADWLQTKFKKSPQMPVYLVALCVSDFVCKHSTQQGVIFGVCAPRTEPSNKLDYALAAAPKALLHLEEITGIQNKLNKIDLLAIPDFYYGAMENWGLVTFRTTALLYSDADSTSSSKMGIASIIAHELAHFWFGNLVTCEWWDVLFLNEAFATFMEYKIVDKIEPDWKFFEMFLMDDFESAVSTDSVDTVHSMLRPITATQQIDQFTSNIVYAKGASVLRMTEYVMGNVPFMDAVKKYLEVNQGKNARETDLLEQFDGKFGNAAIDGVNTATDFLQEWIKEKGFPYVNISKATDGSFTVRQKRFLLSPTGNTETIWKIPLSYYTDAKWTTHENRFLTQVEKVFTNIPTNGLIKFNSGHNGFYLVNYSPEMWNQWIDALVNKFADTQLPPVDRAGLLLDSFYLARGNLREYTVPLKLAKYLVNEDHITPWTIAIRGLTLIGKNVVFGSTYGNKFQEYVQGLVKPIYNNLGWDDSLGTEVKRRLRASILDFACANNHMDCLSRAQQLFNEWREGKMSNDNSKIPKPNLLSTVLKYGLRESVTIDDWSFVWSQFLGETSANLKAIYLTALANTPNQESISMLLNQALEGKVIRSQDANSVFSAVVNSRNSKSLETLWQFYKNNYQRLAATGSPLRPAQLSSILNGICSNYFFTSTRKTELLAFFAQNPTLGLSSSQRSSAINTIDSNIAWIQNRMIEIENFLLCQEIFCPFTVFRLNPQVSPQSYDLKLNVDLENDQFSGSVAINTEITGEAQNLRYLTLTAKGLNITSNKVINLSTGSEIKVTRAFAYKPYDFWVLELESPVKNNQVELQFEFNSKLSTDMAGFYLSQYFEPNTNTWVKLAATQFQATDARRAFPCFDEPQFKSVFNVTLTYQKQYTATMSNNEIEATTTNSDGTLTTKYKPSPEMVTYLLAFVVSDFVCKGDISTSGTKLQVCATPPQEDMISYALSIAPGLLEAFNAKFQFNYNQMLLDKMDIVAIPDFSAGAMENYGLLTFRETALLYNDSVSSAYDKMRVASVLAHEMSHMWTGNLVTCTWWADLWINEAFASFLEWFSVATVEDEWDYKQLFYISDSIAGMNADASLTAHPLVRVVSTPSEIPYISNIIYQKGSSILRMFEFVFSSESFFSTMVTYFEENKFTSISSSIILEAFSKISVENLNSGEFVNSWTRQAGFPYLNLTYNGDASYTVTQERFIASGSGSGNNQTWVVPLSYYKNYQVNNDKSMAYITGQEQNISVQVTSGDSLPVKFNVDSQGFYIVNYPIDEWKKWIELFQSQTATSNTQLTSQDFSHLLFDAFRLSGANYLPYTIALELTPILQHKYDFSVWSTGSSIFSGMWPNFRSSETTGINAHMQKTFRLYAQSLVLNVYAKYGLQTEKPESTLTKRLQSEVTSFACAYGLDQCLLEAQVEYKKWRTQGSALAPDVRSTVLRYAMEQTSDTADWHYLWAEYTKAWQTTIKLDYLQGLAQTSNKELLRLLFERANDQTLVRRQDYLSLYSYAVRTQAGFDVAWDYFTTNYKAIRANRLSASQVGSVAQYFARYLNTKQKKSDFQQFFVDQTDISTTNMNKALEAIDKNIAWASTYRQVVYDWLRLKNSQAQS